MTGTRHKKADGWLLFCYFALIIIGWLNIYASVQSDLTGSIFDFGNRAGKQFVWIMTALPLAAVILYVIDSRVYEVLSFWLYLVTAGLLLLTIFVARDVKGSGSWLHFGPVAFQPAELSKTTTSLFLASVMSRFGYRPDNWRSILKTAVIILIPMLLIVAQKETGSALVYTGLIFMLYREGLPGWILAMAGIFILLFVVTLAFSPYTALVVLLGVLFAAYGMFSGRAVAAALAGIPAVGLLGAAPAVYRAVFPGKEMPVQPELVLAGLFVLALPGLLYLAIRKRKSIIGFLTAAAAAGMLMVFSVDFIFTDILQEHQRKRIEVLLGITEDPTGVGYNVTQSMIAIGSGGFAGKGYLKGTQTAFGFVPEQSTDFIFCTVGEEWGFLGASAVIILYVLLIGRIIVRAEKSTEAFTRIYGYCVACCLFMHFFINIGMTIGLMPVIGIPLPLVSYGGSSLWCFTIMLFIFIALDMRQKR